MASPAAQRQQSGHRKLDATAQPPWLTRCLAKQRQTASMPLPFTLQSSCLGCTLFERQAFARHGGAEARYQESEGVLRCFVVRATSGGCGADRMEGGRAQGPTDQIGAKKSRAEGA